MSEPDITALARRLAEQNNVDWRGLHGSGDGGKIVERDVLDFLARVMAGEEAVNPTPEPLPDGMEAWPDQDIAAVRQGVGEAATLGELRHEIGSAVRDEPKTQAPPASVDEDVFLFDDEPAGEGPAAGAYGGGATSGGDDLEDLLVSGDEPLPLDDPEARPDAAPLQAGEGQAESEPAPEADLFGAVAAQADVDAFAAEPEAQEPGSEWGEDIAIGQPRSGQVVDASDIWGEPTSGETGSAASADVDLFSDAVGGGAQGGSGGARTSWIPGDDDLWSSEAEGGEPAQAQGAATEESDLWAPEPAEGAEQAEPPTAPEPWRDAVRRDEPQDPRATAPAAEASTGGASTADPGAGFAEPGDLASEPEPEELAALAPDPAALGSGEAPEELAAAPVTSLDGLPLARFRTVLRRHVDVSALAAAQLAASQELGYDEPLGAAPFVLRAVAKAADGLGASLGQVALATFQEGVMLRRVDGAATRPFADIVRDLAGSGSEEDEAGLVVADLSGLDLDEVVLDLGLPVVSLGRILYDNQRGGYRSTLTLAGDLPAETGARLLSRVAELLDAPVRLVM